MDNKETILKRLLIDGHITVQELIILGTADFYQIRDPHSFPPKPKTPPDFIWKDKQTNPFVGGPDSNKVMYNITTTSKL